MLVIYPLAGGLTMWDPNTRTPIGKTYAEVDAEQATYVRDLNTALANASDKAARWWHYMVSHQTLELVIGEPASNNNIVICLNACSRIAGPVEWPNQQLELSWHNSPEERGWQYVLTDHSVDFRVDALACTWQCDYDIYRYNSLYSPRDRRE